MSVRLGLGATAATIVVALTGATLVSDAAATLDYEFYKAKVQPIFLTKRPGHAPCVMCHAESNTILRLQKLPEGQTTWGEEDTRKNFEVVSKIVQAVDDPLKAKILTHPLAPEGGGDAYHSGGRQFATKKDPYWKTIAAWVQGATLTSKK